MSDLKIKYTVYPEDRPKGFNDWLLYIHYEAKIKSKAEKMVELHNKNKFKDERNSKKRFVE